MIWFIAGVIICGVLAGGRRYRRARRFHHHGRLVLPLIGGILLGMRHGAGGHRPHFGGMSVFGGRRAPFRGMGGGGFTRGGGAGRR